MTRRVLAALAGACASLGCPAAWAAPVLSVPGIQVNAGGADVSLALKVLLGLTVLSLAPAILVSMTAFIRIVVLSMLRHALGMQETPPNTVIVSLALFLTFFTMAPTSGKVNEPGLQPYMANNGAGPALRRAVSRPLRDFMVRQTREQDLALMVELAKAEQPATRRRDQRCN
jgi:flagellar biosynthetic protein FliP